MKSSKFCGLTLHLVGSSSASGTQADPRRTLDLREHRDCSQEHVGGGVAVISVISVVPPTMYIVGARFEEAITSLTLRLYHHSCGFSSAYFRSYWHQLQASASSGVS